MSTLSIAKLFTIPTLKDKTNKELKKQTNTNSSIKGLTNIESQALQGPNISKKVKATKSVNGYQFIS